MCRLTSMLINCTCYKSGKELKKSSPETINSDLEIDGVFVWVALVDPTFEEMAFFQKQFMLHRLAVEDTVNGHQRAKVDEYNDSLFVVIKTLESVDDFSNQGEIHIFVGTKFVMTVRKGANKGFSNVRNRCESEPELLAHGSGFVLYALMDEIVDRYFPFIDFLENELEILEKDIFQKNMARQNIERLFELKQKLIQVNHVINPFLEATLKLHGGRVPKVCADAQEYFRDVYDHLCRINHRLDNIREMNSTSIQVTLSLISLNESEDNKKLAAWAALFAIPTMMAGIYGMNFKNMPELEWKYGYYVSVGSMILADCFLYRAFKKSKWL
jgi:magnesium transporter